MRPLPALLALAVSVALPSTATAATVHADPTGGPAPCGSPMAPCAAVQDAVDAANPGDTVQLAAGTYTGAVLVTEDLTITGPTGAVLRAPGETKVLEVRDAAATLSGFAVDGTAATIGVLVRNPSLTARTAIVRDLTISGYVEDGLVARLAGLALVAERLTVTGAGAAAPALQRGITVEEGAVATIRDGVVTANCGTACSPAGGEDPATPSAAGVFARGSGASGVTVVGTQLTGNLVGIRAAGAQRLDVLAARLADNGTGVQLVDAQAAVPAAPTQGVVHGTTITGGSRSVVVHDSTPGDGLAPAPVLRADRIVGASAAGAVANVPVDATDVWWGCSGGPGAPGCSTVSADVDASPHLVLRLAAGPTTIATGGGTSSLTADVTRNSAGVATGAAFPDGTPVTFATDRGSVAPPSATTTSGTAGATLTSGADPGTATTSATLDAATATAPVTIAAPPPPTTVTETQTVTQTTPPTTVTVPAATPTPTTPAEPTPTATPGPDGAALLAAARKLIGRKVVRLTPSLAPGTAYVDRSVRTGRGTLTIDDRDVVSLMVISCPLKACDAGVSARVQRTSKAGRTLPEYALRRATFSLDAGKQRLVAVRLTAAQRAGIKRVRSATMVVIAAVSGPGGDRSKQTLRLRIKIRRRAS